MSERPYPEGPLASRRAPDLTLDDARRRRLGVATEPSEEPSEATLGGVARGDEGPSARIAEAVGKDDFVTHTPKSPEGGQFLTPTRGAS